MKDIMVRNIDELVERGEKLDLLVDKTGMDGKLIGENSVKSKCSLDWLI